MSILVSVSKGEKLKRDEVIRRFKEAEDLEELKKIVENSEDRFFMAWDTVEVVDHDGEIAKIDDDLIKTYEDYVNERNGPITDSHSNRVVGQTHAFKVMTHPKTGKTGILTLNRIFNNNILDDKVWQEIKSGKRKGVSIGGQSKDQEIKTEGGLPVRVLEDMDIWEKGTVYEPANPLALTEAISVFAKSKKPTEEDIAKAYKELQKPFAGYKNFADCVAQNQDKQNPEGYCAVIMRNVEGDKMKVIKEEELTDDDFKKANEFLKEKYPWEQCMRDAMEQYHDEETARRVCGAIRYGTVSHKIKKEEDNMTEEIKQDENDLESRLASLEAKVQELESKLAPAEEVTEQEEPKKPEEKPEEETKDTGTTEVNPSPEGGNVKLPQAVSEKVEEDEPKEETDKVQMMEKKLKEIEKKLSNVVTTPRPEIVEKADTEENKEENPAKEILKAMRDGKKVTLDFARNYIIKSREKELDKIFN